MPKQAKVTKGAKAAKAMVYKNQVPGIDIIYYRVSPFTQYPYIYFNN